MSDPEWIWVRVYQEWFRNRIACEGLLRGHLPEAVFGKYLPALFQRIVPESVDPSVQRCVKMRKCVYKVKLDFALSWYSGVDECVWKRCGLSVCGIVDVDPVSGVNDWSHALTVDVSNIREIYLFCRHAVMAEGVEPADGEEEDWEDSFLKIPDAARGVLALAQREPADVAEEEEQDEEEEEYEEEEEEEEEEDE